MFSLTADEWNAINAIGTWIVALVTFFGVAAALVVSFVAVFQDVIRRCVLHPDCELSCGNSGVFLQQTSTDRQQIRLGVRNVGKAPAKDVEAHLLAGWIPNGKEKLPLPKFVPVRLRWTHKNNGVTRSYLVQDTTAFIDFGTLTPLLPPSGICPTTLLTLDAEVEGTDLWQHENGNYVFELGITCSDGFLYRGNIEVSFRAIWGGSDFKIQHRRVMPIPHVTQPLCQAIATVFGRFF